MKYIQTYESFLNENKEIPDAIYHFSYPSAILSILESDKLFAKNLDYERKLSISFTRDINFWKKGISGFKPVRKGAFLAVNTKALKKDGVFLKDFLFKGVKNFDYSKEDEVRAYPTNNELQISKYLDAVGFTKYAKSEAFFVEKIKEFCEQKGIKIIEI